MYQGGAQPNGGPTADAGAQGGASAGGQQNNDVSDVEYEEVNDNKK
jgi:hypothetical protein